MVAMMYTAEMGFRYGFAGAVPGIIGGLASLLVGSTGFMIGPLRKARVITSSRNVGTPISANGCAGWPAWSLPWAAC